MILWCLYWLVELVMDLRFRWSHDERAELDEYTELQQGLAKRSESE